MNRRNLLAAAPVFGFAGLVAGAAAAQGSRIATMHRDIIMWRDICNDPNVSDEASDGAYREMSRLAEDIVDIPARDLGEVMLKFMGHTCNGDHETGECPQSEALWAEARALIGGAA